MRRLLLTLVAVVALGLIATGLWPLMQQQADLDVRTTRVEGTPVTVFAPPTSKPAPAVVIAHGFAGSQQLMQSFAVTLAQNGYVAVTFDFLGHGRNPMPLPGGLQYVDRRTQALLESLGPIVAFARELEATDGRIALLGHSMATEVIVRYARSHPEVAATIAVSPFSDEVTAASPRNLLVVYGASEPAHLHEVGKRIIGMAAGGEVVPGKTYGRFADGSARRLVIAEGVEHTGVVFSPDSLDAAVDWLNPSFDRHSSGQVASRGRWLGLLFVGIVLLAWPLAELLPPVAPEPRGGGQPWRRSWPVILIPPLATPLLLAPVPLGGLPILLGDYLLLHFGLYGALTAIGLWLTRTQRTAAATGRTAWRAFAIAAVATTVYVTLALAIPLDRFVTAYLPVGDRAGLVLVVLAGTLPFFLADEWLTRGPAAPRWGYPVTKALFLLSLAMAILLNVRELFFLGIIAPVMLIFFVVYGLFSRWVYRRTHHPLVAGLANALAIAWGIAATFPVVTD